MDGSALLVDRIWPEPADARAARLRAAALVILGAMIIVADSWIGTEGEPVITLQSFAVLAVALAYGPWLGVAAFGTFLGAGLLGLPAFPGATTWRWSFILAGDFGRMAGSLLAVLLVGFLAARGAARNWLGRIGAPLLGQLLIYVVSIPWLAVYLSQGTGFPFASMLGVAWNEATLPMIPADMAKVVAAALVIWGLGRASARR